MTFTTPLCIQDYFYLGLNPQPGDWERFSLSVGRLYLGLYGSAWCYGWLDRNGCLLRQM